MTVNDYFQYCDLPQDEIDNSIFGHHHTFKNIKRKYVFEILYGLYGVEIAQLQEELRYVTTQLRELTNRTRAFERFLEKTPWENRAELIERLEAARQELARIETDMQYPAKETAAEPNVGVLRARILRLDSEQASVAADLERQRESIRQLERLRSQLHEQSARLTRAIVSGRFLLDFDFVVCPRCGTQVSPERGGDETCFVCLQSPTGTFSRETLIKEQDRLNGQIRETEELIARRSETSKQLDELLIVLATRRQKEGKELDLQVSAFVSDSASEIANSAAYRAEVAAAVQRLSDYLSLYERLDAVLGDIAQLTEEKARLESAIETAASEKTESESRIRFLELELERTLESFGTPRFESPPSAVIDRQTFLPVVDGRRYDEISSLGLKVLVSMAHALAHHTTAITMDLPLPGILLIDGPSSNVGHVGYDQERLRDVYSHLMRVSEELGGELQLIVADNSVPPEADEYVRLRLSEEDRLIPANT